MRHSEHAVCTYGFTLIETLVVLIILALILSIYTTRDPAAHQVLDLRAGTTAMVESLRLARSRAIATNQPCLFVVNAAAHTYRIADDPPQHLPADLALHVTTVVEAVEGGSAAIGFAPDGGSTGGRIDFAAGERRTTVAINWLTGRVSIDSR